MKTPHFASLLVAALAPQAIAQDSSPAPWDGFLEGIQDSFVARRAGTVDGTDPGGFYRLGNYPILDNLAASEDGMTLIYTDSEMERLGFVDITDPADPHGMGFVQLPGEPTAVSVSGDYALCAINTSANFVDTSGDLLVVDIASQTIVRTMPLGGQPDSVAVSPDGQFCAIAIENERDEDDPATGGAPPQLPAGYLVIIDLTGIADLYPEDPEPAEALYERVCEQLRQAGLPVATGRFGASMAVELENDGPVTFLVKVRDGSVLARDARADG